MDNQEIPWDEFPEATHYQYEDDDFQPSMLKLDGDKWSVYPFKGVGAMKWSPIEYDFLKPKVAVRPVEFKIESAFNEKNPPLNTPLMYLPLQCEFWKVGEVRYIGSHYVVIWNSGTREEQPYELGNVVFAPLKSEKDEALEEIASLIGKGIWQVEALRIWNAGYRKIKSGENE